MAGASCSDAGSRGRDWRVVRSWRACTHLDTLGFVNPHDPWSRDGVAFSKPFGEMLEHRPNRLDIDGQKISPARNPSPGWAFCWWRWAESNRRPKALHPRHYMLSSPLSLAPGQHGVRSAPRSQPALFDRKLAGGHFRRFRDNDPTPTSTDTRWVRG